MLFRQNRRFCSYTVAGRLRSGGTAKCLFHSVVDLDVYTKKNCIVLKCWMLRLRTRGLLELGRPSWRPRDKYIATFYQKYDFLRLYLNKQFFSSNTGSRFRPALRFIKYQFHSY
jgi:hypothetical protein